jgi:hypothetical protein
MSIRKRSTNVAATKDIHEILNDHDPIRLAFIGGAKTGKSSIVSKVSIGTFQDTYYPTHKVSPMLINFNAKGKLSRIVLDELHNSDCLHYLVKCDNVLLSPILEHGYTLTSKPKLEIVKQDVVIHSSNNYYTLFNYKDELTNDGYTPPHISPILIELIDTPCYDPNTVIPFLEASLYNKLDEKSLKNLASEPRKPVNANPILVASGASELNGLIDGYFLVYSAVPSYNPPSYNEPESAKSTDISKVDSDSIPGDNTFSLLSTIKNTLDEAWIEYFQFKQSYYQTKESDIFSFKSALKNLWKDQITVDSESKDELLHVNPNDPLDPNGSPPIWIVCTHANSPLRSPILIENGAKLSKMWKCGFVAVDNTNDNVDEVIALMVRDILVRQKLQKSKKRANN